MDAFTSARGRAVNRSSALSDGVSYNITAAFMKVVILLNQIKSLKKIQ